MYQSCAARARLLRARGCPRAPRMDNADSLRRRTLAVLLRTGTPDTVFAQKQANRRLAAALYQLRARGHAAAADTLESAVARLVVADGLVEPHAVLLLVIALADLSNDAARTTFGAAVGKSRTAKSAPPVYPAGLVACRPMGGVRGAQPALRIGDGPLDVFAAWGELNGATATDALLRRLRQPPPPRPFAATVDGGFPATSDGGGRLRTRSSMFASLEGVAMAGAHDGSAVADRSWRLSSVEASSEGGGSAQRGRGTWRGASARRAALPLVRPREPPPTGLRPPPLPSPSSIVQWSSSAPLAVAAAEAAACCPAYLSEAGGSALFNWWHDAHRACEAAAAAAAARPLGGAAAAAHALAALHGLPSAMFALDTAAAAEPLEAAASVEHARARECAAAAARGAATCLALAPGARLGGVSPAALSAAAAPVGASGSVARRLEAVGSQLAAAGAPHGAVGAAPSSCKPNPLPRIRPRPHHRPRSHPGPRPHPGPHHCPRSPGGLCARCGAAAAVAPAPR